VETEISPGDVFKLSEKAVDRVSGRRPIEATANPDNRVLKLRFNRTNSVNIAVIAVEEATHQL